MTYFKKLTVMALLWLSVPGAFAAMVPTAQMNAEAHPAPLANVLDQRDQVRQQLVELGVDPVEASQRVSQMTDQQISTVQGKIAELPAGAGVSTTNLLLIIILLILIL
jgi:TolA-binding protein